MVSDTYPYIFTMFQVLSAAAVMLRSEHDRVSPGTRDSPSLSLAGDELTQPTPIDQCRRSRWTPLVSAGPKPVWLGLDIETPTRERRRKTPSRTGTCAIRSPRSPRTSCECASRNTQRASPPSPPLPPLPSFSSKPLFPGMQATRGWLRVRRTQEHAAQKNETEGPRGNPAVNYSTSKEHQRVHGRA